MSTFTTIAALARLTDRELNFLYRSVLDRLAGYSEGTAERRDLICRVIVKRQAHRPKPGSRPSATGPEKATASYPNSHIVSVRGVRRLIVG